MERSRGGNALRNGRRQARTRLEENGAVRNFKKTIVAAVAMTTFMAGQASALCVSDNERQAMTMRVLQTELMVAALTCGQQGAYNRFINQFEGELVTRGKTLRSAFQRLYGGKGQSRLDGFVTRLANEASQRSIGDRDGFCPRASALFDVVLKTPSAGLIAVAEQQPFGDAHGATECTTRVASDASAAKPKAKP
jgi:hypothetical protein